MGGIPFVSLLTVLSDGARSTSQKYTKVGYLLESLALLTCLLTTLVVIYTILCLWSELTAILALAHH